MESVLTSSAAYFEDKKPLLGLLGLAECRGSAGDE